MYTATVIQIDNLRPHSNADRLQLTTIHGNQVVVGLNTKIGDVGVFFPTDGQLSKDFCKENNLYSKPEDNSDGETKGYLSHKRRVKAISLRGEKSEGMFMPLSCLDYLDHEYPILGMEFTESKGKPICNKYINPETLKRGKSMSGTKSSKITNKMFHEHFDTSQFGRNSRKIKEGDLVIVTEKLHGTSQRTSNVLVERELNWFEKLLLWFGVNLNTKKWSHLIGTRRVILKDKPKDSGYYSTDFREATAQPFIGNLKKGEIVYYEVVGYENAERPIMGSHSNSKLKGHLSKENYKRFIKEYGEKTVFNYNCKEGENDIYVYRIARVNQDGDLVDLSWDAVIERCNELGVKHVPELTRIRVTDSQVFEQEIQELANNYSYKFPNHIREGVCVRVDNGIKPLILKEKSFQFKVLEGIIKDSGFVDAEEIQGV